MKNFPVSTQQAHINLNKLL